MLQSNEELRLCAEAHEQEVIVNDSYGLRALLEKDPGIEYVVDIGGNVGAFSSFVHSLLPGARIILCEPEEMMMGYAKLNTGNELVYVQKAIIGDREVAEVKFNICKWQGNHHVDGRFNWDNYTPAGSVKVGDRMVPAATVNDVAEQNGFPRIDLLKIDTEGSEPEILESLVPYLHSVRHIVGEWHSQADLARIKEALSLTHDAVYTDGAFREPSGLIANGGFAAELKK